MARVNILAVRTKKILLAIDFRDIGEVWAFQITCTREMSLLSGGHVTLSGNCCHDAQCSGRRTFVRLSVLWREGREGRHRLRLEIVGSAEENVAVQRHYLLSSHDFDSEFIRCWKGTESSQDRKRLILLKSTKPGISKCFELEKNHPAYFVLFCILFYIGCGDAFCKQRHSYPVDDLLKESFSSFSTRELSQPSSLSRGY